MRQYEMSEVQIEERTFISKVYSWMFIALLITALTAMYTVNTESLLRTILGNQILFFGLIIGEFVLVGVLVKAVRKLSFMQAMGIFVGYSVLNGLTLSVIFLVYTAGSIATTFFVASGLFGIMSIYGFLTKTDLTKIGNLAMMGLFGFIIASLINLFLKSSALYWITTYIGIAIFIGLIAYDTQKIKQLNYASYESEEMQNKIAVIGALTIYLDFINLFLLLLRIFGRRK